MVFSRFLRIDSSGRSVICVFNHISNMSHTNTCDVSNKRAFFALSYDRSHIYIKADLR